jgi:hypothetical protein
MEQADATPNLTLLLVEQVVLNGEEKEDIVLEMKAGLYACLETGTGVKKWKKQGDGVVRFLHHQKRLRLRLVMRHGINRNVIANHVIDPRITLTPHVNSDSLWEWFGMLPLDQRR